MAEQSTATAPAAKPAAQAPDAERSKVIESYLAAPTREAKAALVAKHPWLGEIFSAINHS